MNLKEKIGDLLILLFLVAFVAFFLWMIAGGIYKDYNAKRGYEEAHTIDINIPEYLQAIDRYQAEKISFQTEYISGIDSSYCVITREIKTVSGDSTIIIKVGKPPFFLTRYEDCKDIWYNPNFHVSNYIIWYDENCQKVIDLEKQDIICSKSLEHGCLHKSSTDSLNQINAIFYVKCSFNDSAEYGRQLNRYKYENYNVEVWMIEESTNIVQGFTKFRPPIFTQRGEPDVSNIEAVDEWAEYLKNKQY